MLSVNLTRPRFMMLAAGLLVVAAGVAGCGGDDDDDTVDTTPRATNTISGGAATTEPEDTEEPEESATAEPEATDEPSSDGEVDLELSAKDLKFDKDKFTVPAGSQVTLTFVNEEAVPHDFALFENEDAENELFRGDMVTDDTIVYEFEAPTEPGTYFFRCNVHPTDMVGDFIVE